MATISRNEYVNLFGPTVGDRIRLGDTGLFVEIERDLRRPLPCSLLSRFVQNDIDERLLRDRIDRPAHAGGQLGEKRGERALIPFRKDVSCLRGAQAETAAQHIPRFGDELHVAIFDPVVHHLDEMTGTVRTDMGDARTGFRFRRDRLEHVADDGP